MEIVAITLPPIVTDQGQVLEKRKRTDEIESLSMKGYQNPRRVT